MMNNIKELENILYMYLKENDIGDFIYIQRIVDIVLKNNYNGIGRKFNTHISLSKSLELVYKFFKELNPNYQQYFEKRLNDGTFIFDSNLEIGCSFYDEKYNRRICIPINNNIHDAFIIVHELIHDINLQINSNSNTRSLFTESFSILGEMLFHDYLMENKLYINDANKNLSNLFWEAYKINMKNDFEIKLCLSYLNNGYLNDKMISELYSKNDDYNFQIYYSIMAALSDKTFALDIEQRYSIGILFASYMHQRILNNTKKIDELFSLNEIVNDITIKGLINFLDLDVETFNNTVLTYDSLEKLDKAYQKELRKLR